jgi:(p)ppGpp synthase/HD superfamily hydrolase
MLEKALQIASCAHKNQKRRNGEAYINHPLRVMAKMTTEAEKCVAILHDVVEDTHVTLDDLRVFFTPEIVEAVDLMTRKDDSSYFGYIGSIKNNPLARVVKIADLEDNMDVRQLPYIGIEDVNRLQKYVQVYRILTDYTPIE